jgi:hypothetical protein
VPARKNKPPRSARQPRPARPENEIAAAAKAESNRHRDYLCTLIHHLDAIIEAAPDHLARLDVAVLRQQRDEVQELVDRITVQMRTRDWLYFGLLQAAENAGVDLGYTSPSRSNKGKPYGSGIDYLIAAAAKHGHLIGPDRAHALLVAFNTLPRVGAKLGGASELKAYALVLRKGQVTDE